MTTKFVLCPFETKNIEVALKKCPVCGCIIFNNIAHPLVSEYDTNEKTFTWLNSLDINKQLSYNRNRGKT